MENRKALPITLEDVEFIVKDQFEMIIDLAKYNSFCIGCIGKNEPEMLDLKVVLNEMDDLIFQGKCRYCNGKMKRYIELGESKEYHMRTQLIRESKQNKN